MCEDSSGRLMGYIIGKFVVNLFTEIELLLLLCVGKAEGEGNLWHGHVSAVTVSPEYRRLGLARLLMDYLELCTDKAYFYNGYFVDLFVRTSNSLAISMYKNLGYSVYRRVLDYYSGEEDAYDMRKAMSRDVHRASVVPLLKPIKPHELEW